MYSFNELAPLAPCHTGFVIIVALVAFMSFLWIVFMFGDEDFFKAFFFNVIVAGVLLGFTYKVSYVWTDQTVIYYKNEKVTGTFVQYMAEGYNEEQRHGKQTRHVDVHNLYVVYEVGGAPVVLDAAPGYAYPKHVTLYKN